MTCWSRLANSASGSRPIRAAGHSCRSVQRCATVMRMDPAQLHGHVRRGPVDTLPVADASRQLDAITRYVAQARTELTRREEAGDFPALDAEKALDFARTAEAISLTDDTGETVAVIISPAVLEVLEDALGLLQGELDRARGTSDPITTEELLNHLNGRMNS